MNAHLTLEHLSAHDVARLLDAHAIVLIDVREPQEYAAERIPGALLYPLSTFDPLALPPPGDCRVIFHCGSGKRSATAADICLAKGIAHHAHLAGGIGAWKAAGLATIRIDAATGRVSAQR